MEKEKFDLENFPTSNSAKKMLSYVTDGFYDKSYVGKWLYQVMGVEYDEAQELAEALPEQFFPETATWGLIWHERKWNLPVRENLSYQERRRLIYQKRDYRVPMTPYRMETYLEDATGFKVRIADVNDPGDYGFVAPHPNVFKVFFMGEGTLESKKAKAILDKLKQSHTVYTMNDRTEIELNCKKLENVWLRKIIFQTSTPFWDCYVFNGEIKMDGGTSFDRKRRYNLVLDFKYDMGSFFTPHTAELSTIKFRAKLNNQEDANVKTGFCFDISFWDTRIFNGSLKFDGTECMDAIRRYELHLGIKSRLAEFKNYQDCAGRLISIYRQKNQMSEKESVRISFGTDFWRTAYMDGEFLFDGSTTMNYSRYRPEIVARIGASIKGTETAEIQIVTKTRDYSFMDGNIKFDGSRNFNSIYRKEAVE